MNEQYIKPHHENELLPCPFCGCHEIVYAKYTAIVGERWKVVCCGCMAAIDPGYAQDWGVVQRLWNRRALEEA